MKLIAIPFLLVIAFTNAQIASNLSTYGSEFFVGFYEHVHTANTHTLYVHTLKTTSVSFSVTSLDGVFSFTGTTTYHSPRAVSIPYSYEVRDRGYSWRRKGLRVSSLETEPVSVLAWSYRSSADYMSFLALPCHKQPTTEYTYYVVSTYGWSNQMSQFLIVGCVDNTNVTIIPNNDITVPSDPQSSVSPNIVVSAGGSFDFILHSLQTFFVFQPYVDLTGTKIISDGPLSIISGHETSRVPAGVFDGDPIVTQLTPTITWGKSFLLPPHYSRTNGQSYKVIATNNMTNAVKTCGPFGSFENITFDANNTHWFYTTNNMYCSIISDQPIYVAQVGVSANYDSGSNGDPCLNTVPPIEQYERSTQFTAFFEATGYYSVVMPNDAYFNQGLMINGFLNNLTWTSIYAANGSVIGYGYSAAVTGSNTIAHPNPNGKLFVSVYGFTTYGGYSYVGGMKLNPINIKYVLPEISFSAVEYTVKEGDGMVYVYLQRLKEFDSNVSVHVYVNPTPVDTALSIQDYSSIDIVLNFTDGQTIKNVSIPIMDDMYVEPTEYFTVSIEALDGDVVFPITDTVIKIIDDDDIQIGFTSDETVIEDNDLVTIKVMILNGTLQMGLSIPFSLQIGIVNGENSTIMACELSSLHPWIIFGFNLSNLGSFDANSTQTIWSKLWITDSSVNSIVSPNLTNIVPISPVMSSSMSSSSMMSSSMTSSSAMTSVSVTTVTDTETQLTTVCPFSTPTISIIVTTSTVSATCPASITKSVTVCPSRSVKDDKSSIIKGNEKTSSIKATETFTAAKPNFLTREISLAGGAFYLSIGGFIVAIIVILIFSFFCCMACYQRGKQKGRKLEIKLEREIEMSATNDLYESIHESMTDGFNPSVDEKKLLQYMQ